MRTPISIEQLQSRLSPLLLDVDDGHNLDRVVSTFVLFDGSDPGAIPAHAVVLGIGVADQRGAGQLARAIDGSNVAAVVLRDSVARDNRMRSLLGADVPVLVLREHASWTQLTRTLTVILGLERGQSVEESIFGDAETDLFTLANSVAGIVVGPVTIEDLSSRVLAFSSDQATADEARMQTVLGHQVPESYHAVLREHDHFRRIYDSPVPVFIDSIDPGVRGRVAMRLQAGGELLGSVWVVTDSPLTPQRQQGLTEAANVIALTMLRIRMTNDSAARLRASRVLALVDGGVQAREVVKSIGISAKGFSVVALGVDSTSTSSDARFELDRLASAFMMHVQLASPKSPVALLGDIVYAVILLESDLTAFRTRVIVDEFLTRLSKTRRVVIGIGQVVEDPARLADSRSEADLVLRVLRQRNGGSAAATAADVIVDSLLLRMSDLMADSQETITGPLRHLVDYDAQFGSKLVETLRSWLDQFGDIATAAESLMIHKNTFRYRLRRIREIAGIDLSDSQQRFALMLQLRLFLL
jgi:hypothetical protein